MFLWGSSTRRRPVARMADTELERRLREAGSGFIESHRQAESAIREAASAGMPPDAIVHVSGLSPETVGAFLRQLGYTPKVDVKRKD